MKIIKTNNKNKNKQNQQEILAWCNVDKKFERSWLERWTFPEEIYFLRDKISHANKMVMKLNQSSLDICGALAGSLFSLKKKRTSSLMEKDTYKSPWY